MKRKYFKIKAASVLIAFSLGLYSQPLLTDTSATYSYKNENFKCGLYEGTNKTPDEHLMKGLEVAKEMRKMSKINITVIGHSVPTNIFNGWNWNNAKSQFKLAANTNLSSACAGAVMAWDWLRNIRNGQKLAGFNNSDVHVIFVQLTWAPFMGPDNYEKNTPLSQKIDSMSHDFGRLAKDAKKNYPNLKMMLFQADPWQNNHEPYHAYHEWFFARQVVLDQIRKASDYTGPSVDELWIGIGGYFWYPNAPSQYYSDCCHITPTGAVHYQEKWIKGLIDYNPVVAHWLLENPPEITAVNSETLSLSSAGKFYGKIGTNGVEVVFSLVDAAKVGMGLFSIDGKAVVPMSERECRAGLNSIQLNTGKQLTAGTYILRIDDGAVSRSVSLATSGK